MPHVDLSVLAELAVTNFLDEAEKRGWTPTALCYIYNEKFDYKLTEDEFVRALANNAVTFYEFLYLHKTAFGHVAFH